MKRLLMIEQGGRGGVADYTAQLAQAIAAEGWQVALASAEDHCYAPIDGVRIHPVFHYVRGHGRLARTARRWRLGRLANALSFLATIPKLVRLGRASDVVHTQGWEYAPLGLLAVGCLRVAGATIVQTPHNTFERGWPLEQTPRWLMHTNALLARLTARTIVHAEADLARVTSAAEGRVVVIPHGEYGTLAETGGSVDRDLARAELAIPDGAPVTLMFGQLRVDKGLGDLLAAMRRLPELYLLIGGQEDGALAACGAQLADPQLAGRVIVREGYLEMHEAAKLFAATDTVALPYAVASQSGVLLLSYGFRRPVVIYPVGGLAEAVLDGETGWICARPDVDSLLDALADAAACGWPECRRRGEAGARLAGKRFAWPEIARRTVEVYRAALAEEMI